MSIVESSDSSHTDDTTRNAIPKRKLSPPQGATTSRTMPKTKYISVPVCNTRHNQHMAKFVFYKYRASSVSRDDIIAEVAKDLAIEEKYVYCIESKGQREETAIKTCVIILPEQTSCSIITVILECYATAEQMHPDMWCIRIEPNWKIDNVKSIIRKHLRWNGVGICMDKTLLSDSKTVKQLGICSFDRLQVICKAHELVKFYHQPIAAIEKVYSLTVDTSDSVGAVKQKLIDEFMEELHDQIQQSTLRIAYRDMVLDDSHCFGLVNRHFKDEVLQIHFADANAICVTLRYNCGMGKHRRVITKQLVIRPDCSTAFLREEVAKRMKADSKAIKLTIDCIRVNELENLQRENVLYDRCVVDAGVKKRKALLVKHPEVADPVLAAELYTVETVDTLKTCVAKAFDLNKLHIALLCRGTEMQDGELLLHYPVKNRMVVDMVIYERRNILNIIISLFQRQKASLSVIVDDTRNTTVDDVLRFCGHTYNYPRCCSRAIFQQRCLGKRTTIEDSGLQSGDTIVIVFFHQLEIAVGNLRRIFVVDEHGVITKRYGSVVNGILLHASKKLELPTLKEDHQTCNGDMPTGIRSLGPRHMLRDGTSLRNTKQDKTDSGVNEKGYTTAELRKFKETFLKRAKGVAMKQRKICNISPEKKQVQTETPKDTENTPIKDIHVQHGDNEQESPTSSMQCDERCIHAREDHATVQTLGSKRHQREHNKTKKKQEKPPKDKSSNRPQFYIEKSDNGSHSDTNEIYAIEENLSSPISERMSDTTSDVFSDTRYSSGESDAESESREASANGDCKLDTSSDHFRNDNQHHSDRHMPVIHTLQDTIEDTDSATESLSPHGNHEHVTHGRQRDDIENESLFKIDSEPAGPCRVSVMRLTSKAEFAVSVRPSKRTHRNRRRIRTVGELALEELKQFLPHIPHNPTYTELFHSASNDNINTAGITVPLLVYISQEIGPKWKQLGRKLGVPECTLASIEHTYRHALSEASIQTLLHWKQAGGIDATKDGLIDALKEICRQDLAKMCENSDFLSKGYHTA